MVHEGPLTVKRKVKEKEYFGMCNPDDMINESTTPSSKIPEEVIEDTIDCPLFMDGLPNDFQSNPQLAAIASLLDDDGTSTKEDENDTTPQDSHTNSQPPSKSRESEARAKSRSLRRIAMSSPYQPPTTKSKTAKTPWMGEAQLFLKMWKL